MSVQIYYFSGTGNSLHAARELADRMPGAQLVPIVGALRAGKPASRADAVGIVFPIHAFSAPIIVKQFLRTADFSSAAYIFAFATRFCSVRAYSEIDKLLRKQGKSLDAGFCVKMPENYLPVFDVETDDESARLESDLMSKLDDIKIIIENRRKYRETVKVPFIFTKILFPLMTFVLQKTRYFHLEKTFCADGKCTGCGSCEKICLSGKISMENGKPAWNKNTDCLHCFACIHYCPSQAIQFKGKKTEKRGRYHHPSIGAKDIAQQRSIG